MNVKKKYVDCLGSNTPTLQPYQALFYLKKKTHQKTNTHTQQICLQKVSFEVDGWIPVRVSPALGSYH